LEERGRGADRGGVARLIRVRRGTRPSADGDDRLRPELGVEHLFSAVCGETKDQIRVAHVLPEAPEDEAAVQLRRTVEVQERELAIGDLHAQNPSSILR